jgi:hypothetical protein
MTNALTYNTTLSITTFTIRKHLAQRLDTECFDSNCRLFILILMSLCSVSSYLMSWRLSYCCKKFCGGNTFETQVLQSSRYVSTNIWLRILVLTWRKILLWRQNVEMNVPRHLVENHLADRHLVDSHILKRDSSTKWRNRSCVRQTLRRQNVGRPNCFRRKDAEPKIKFWESKFVKVKKRFSTFNWGGGWRGSTRKYPFCNQISSSCSGECDIWGR